MLQLRVVEGLDVFEADGLHLLLQSLTEALSGSLERIFLLGETEANHLVVAPVGIKRRDRNDSHADFARHPFGKLPVGQIRDAVVARQLKIGAATGQ